MGWEGDRRVLPPDNHLTLLILLKIAVISLQRTDLRSTFGGFGGRI
jgi:hypothetical protein